MTLESEIAQEQFLQRGGVLSRAIAAKIESGEMTRAHVFREYPKMLQMSRGVQSIACSTEDIRGKLREWTEEREIFDEVIVHSEEEEERVRAGGRTSTQLEQERLDLLARCRNAGVRADPLWSAVRLRRELGEAMDAAPADDESRLHAELEKLRRIKEMRAEIARLNAELAEAPAADAEPVPASDEIEDLRVQLRALGVKPDLRWGEARLRAELERATAPA